MPGEGGNSQSFPKHQTPLQIGAVADFLPAGAAQPEPELGELHKPRRLRSEAEERSGRLRPPQCRRFVISPQALLRPEGVMFTKTQGGEGRVGGGVCALQSNQSSSVAAGLDPSDQRAGSGQAFQGLLCAGNVSGQVGKRQTFQDICFPVAEMLTLFFVTFRC